MNAYLRLPARTTARIAIPNFAAGLETRFDETVLNPTAAAELYNFDVSSGALTDGWGLGTARLDGVKESWYYLRGDEKILMYRTADGVYALRGGVTQKLPLTFTAPISAVNYRLYGEDVIILCSAADDMAVWNGTDAPYTVEGSPRVTSMALHYERLFVTVKEGTAVYFSDDLDPTNWAMDLSAGGFIELADGLGRLNRIVSYLNYLYIFRDYGISRMVAYADQTEFSVSNLFVSSGRIYADTVAVCGDRVLFLADDGLYAFDGLSTVKILKGLDGLFDGGKPTADYWAGAYRLSCRIRGNGVVGCESGDFTNNGLIVYRPGDGVVSISRGVDIAAFSEDECLSGGKLYRLEKNGLSATGPLPRRWRVPMTDCGKPGAVKQVRELSFESDGDVTVTVCSERGQVVRTFSGPGVKHMRPQLSGRKIGLLIEAKDSCYITRPNLVIRSGGV